MYLVKSLAKCCALVVVMTIYVTPVFAQNWHGVYFGGHVGYNIGENEGELGGDIITDYTQNLDSFVGGIYGGFNLQAGQIVFGIEGDLTFLQSDDKNTFTSTQGFVTDTFNYGVEQSFSANIRARIGVLATDNILLYAAGGIALGSFDGAVGLTVSTNGNDVTGSSSDDEMIVGYTVGGGVEMKLTTALILRAEYLFTDFGTETFALPVSAGENAKDLSDSADLTSHLVRVGLAIKF